MNHILNADKDMYWCNATPTVGEFSFKDLEQVTINNLHGERRACSFCVLAAVTALVRIPDNALLTTTAQPGILTIYGDDT